MRKVFQYLRPYAGKMSLGLVIKFIGTIMDLLLPWILSFLIDTIVPRRDQEQILLWGGAMALCAAVAVVTNIAANRMASRVAQLTTRSLRHDLFSKIACLSCRQVDGYTVSSLESRLTSDTYNVHQMIGMMQRLGVRAPILLLGGMIVTLLLEPALALVLLCTLPFIGLLVWLVSKKGIPLYGQLQQGVDQMVRTVRENVAGIRVIKALSKTEYEKRRFAAVNREVVDRETRAGVTMALTNPMMNLFLNIGLTVVVLVGAFRVDAGLTQPGKILAFLTYFTIILNAMLSITRMFVMYSKGSASADRIAQVLDAGEDLGTQPLPVRLEESHIVFEHVSFSYNHTAAVLKDISFDLPRGGVLGIIGATGSGKSSICSLLMRLYDADEGEIRIDGRPVRSIPPEELHRMFGVVFQNDILFADTIAANIDFGRGLSPDALEKAARAAQALPFIQNLPGGMSYRLTARGTNLSGGQKQRLLIARALAGQPEILILDDSSSALDYKTDAGLRRALRENYAGVTTVVIAQRISSIRHADRILVLENGAAIGYGSHSRLMRDCAVYRQISRSQMGEAADVPPDCPPECPPERLSGRLTGGEADAR